MSGRTVSGPVNRRTVGSSPCTDSPTDDCAPDGARRTTGMMDTTVPRWNRRRMADDDDVRRLALALPGTIERPSYGTPGFRVSDRLFARMHDQPGLLVLWRASVEDR